MSFLRFLKIAYFLILAVFMESCLVSNNMYLNDPKAHQKGKSDIYLGLGNAYSPRVDSVDINDNVYYSRGIQTVPVLSVLGQGGIGNNLDIRGAVHIPAVVLGFGMRAGIQYSFLDSSSKFQAAIATDIGLCFSEDSSEIGGVILDNVSRVRGFYNADIFLPMSYKLGDNFNLILTPRLSNTWTQVRRNLQSDRSKFFTERIQTLSLGLDIKKFYFEASINRWRDRNYPSFALMYRIE